MVLETRKMIFNDFCEYFLIFQSWKTHRKWEKHKVSYTGKLFSLLIDERKQVKHLTY